MVLIGNSSRDVSISGLFKYVGTDSETENLRQVLDIQSFGNSLIQSIYLQAHKHSRKNVVLAWSNFMGL